MKLKVFTFRFSENSVGFDDQAMQEFIADKEVIEFAEHFFVHEKTPYLTVLLSYRDMSSDERRKTDRRQDPRTELDDREKEAYDALRTWRAARARQDGIPPYMITNNRQIAKMIKLKSKTIADLAKVNGIGDAKTAQYGKEILEVIEKHLISEPVGNPKGEKEPEK